MPIKVIAILIIGLAVNIYIAAAPSILGALVDYQGWSNDVAGRLIAYNFWGGTISTISAIFILHRPGWNLRLTMFVCLLAVILTSIGSVWLAASEEALGVVRFVNGLGAGLGFTTAAVALVGTPRIERSYAILYGATFLISGVAMALLPHVYHASGIEGAFYGMGAINLLACVLLPFFPKTVGVAAEAADSSVSNPGKQMYVLAGFMLTALFLHYLFNSGIWTYFERLGVAFDMSAATTGAILGPSMSAAIVGMIGAALLGSRLGYILPIYIGTVVIMLSTLSLLFSSSALVFGIGTAVFNASITFVTPYFVALLALLIPSGRGVSAANIATLAGFSSGPFLISYLVAGGEFRLSIWLTAAGFVLVFGIVFEFSRRLQRNTPADNQIRLLSEIPRPGLRQEPPSP